MFKENEQTVVGVVAKASQPRALEHARDLITYLTGRGLPYVTTSDILARLGLVAQQPQKVVTRAELIQSSSLVVVLGGDGTLISVARHPSSRGVPIVGVNLGTLGFLTEIGIDELYPTLELALAGKAQLENRMLLEIRACQQEREIFFGYALNDLVISKEAMARIFGVEVRVDGEFAAVLRGDGVIVGTPSGSTAYSLAAGGSIVHPGVQALLITPICPHSLTSRPLVLPFSSEITLTVPHPPSGVSNEEVFLTIDGQEGLGLGFGSEVKDQDISETGLFRSFN